MVALLCNLSSGATLVVKSGGGGDYTAIQAALDAAGQNDVIEVQDNATYTENLVFPTGVTGLTLRAGTGFSPTITLSGSPASGYYIEVVAPGTIIEDFTINFSGPSAADSCLIYASGGASTIRDCVIVGPGDNKASGIANMAVVDNVEISQCKFGMVCNVPGFSYSISGCHFYDNSDCAVVFADGTIVMDNCLLETSGVENMLTNGTAGTLDVLVTNSTIRDALGFRNLDLQSPGTVTIEDSLIMNANFDEILQYTGTLNLNRCIIKANNLAGVVSYSGFGGGITNIDHCDIKGNGNQWTVYTLDNNAVMTITNSIVTGNMGLYAGLGTISSNYNDIFCSTAGYTSVSPGPNDISADPLYVQTSDSDANDFFKLQPVSPAATADDLGSYLGSQGVQLNGSPVADFTASPTFGDAPLQVTFTDTSTPGSEPITEWYWDFGDANTATIQNPTHTYSEGTYTVSLTVTTSIRSNTKTRTNYITAQTAGSSGLYTHQLYGGRDVIVRNISDLTDQAANNLIEVADRSTKTDQPVTLTTIIGLMQTGDRCVVTNRYVFWMDCSLTDGPGGYTWASSGILTGIWSLDNGSFKYKVKGPNASSIEASEWAPNELIRGSNSPDGQDHHWDRYPQSFDILVAYNGNWLVFNWAQGKPLAQWTITENLTANGSNVVWEVTGYPVYYDGSITFAGTNISVETKFRLEFSPNSDWFDYKVSFKPSEDITMENTYLGVWLAYDEWDPRKGGSYPWGLAPHEGFYKGKYKYAYSPGFGLVQYTNHGYIVTTPDDGYNLQPAYTQPPYELHVPRSNYAELVPMEEYLVDGQVGGIIRGWRLDAPGLQQPTPGQSLLLWSTSQDKGSVTSNYPIGIEARYVNEPGIYKGSEKTMANAPFTMTHENFDACLDLGWGWINLYYDSSEWTICEMQFRTNLEKSIEDYNVPNWIDYIPGDFEPDGDVDLADLSFLFSHWLDTGGDAYSGADLTGDGDADLADFAVFAMHWMKGVE